MQLYENVKCYGTVGSLSLAKDGFTFRSRGADEDEERDCPWSGVAEYTISSSSAREHKLKLILRKVSKKTGTEKRKDLFLQFETRAALVQIEMDITKRLRHIPHDPINRSKSLDWKYKTSTTTTEKSGCKASKQTPQRASEQTEGPPPRCVVSELPIKGISDDVKRRPELWSITYEQLLEFNEQAKKTFGRKYKRATMRDINRRILEPHCLETGKSYALSLNPEGLMVEAFITHAWDEPFAAFVESIRHCFHTTLVKPTLWICAFALMQGDAHLIEEQIGTLSGSLDNSPFVKALSKAKTFVVVRNSTVDLYSRIWCICELLHGKRLGLVPNKAFVTGPNNFSKKTTSCLDAKASNPKDRDMILRILLTEYDREVIDGFVNKFRAYEPPRLSHNVESCEIL